MAIQKHGENTPKGTPPQPQRLASKRKRLWWWKEHEEKAILRRQRREREENERILAAQKAKVEAMRLEQEAKRKARR